MGTNSTVRDTLLAKYGTTASTSGSGSDSSEKDTGQSSGQSFASIRAKLLDKYSDKANKQNEQKEKVTSWLKKYSQVTKSISDYANKLNGAYTQDVSGGFSSQIEELLEEYDTISTDFKAQLPNSYRYYKDLKELSESISQGNDFMAQFASEDEYNSYVAKQKDYEEKKNLDIPTAEKEIKTLESTLNEYRNLTRWMTDEKGTARAEAIRKEYGGEDEIEALVAEKKRYLNQSKYIQKGAALSGVSDPESAAYDRAFEQLSQYASTQKAQPQWWENGVGDFQYEWINNKDGFRDNYESGQKRMTESTGGKYSSPYLEKNYDKLTEDEIAIYNYHYAKEGKEKAQQYLDSIQESLNMRTAQSRFQQMEGQTALELAFGIEAGLDQFNSGVAAFLNTEDDYIAQTAVQMASQMVRDDLSDNGAKTPNWMGGSSIGQMVYDAVTTSANMAPSILASIGMNFLLPGSGQYVGSALMGMSAAGSAYQEALNEGYGKDQARGYSLLVGGSEMVMEKLLGGISALGGNSLGKYFANSLSNADTALKAVARKLGGSMLSEFGEEYIQEVLTPVFQNLMLGTDEDVELFSAEALYSGILGALTAGIMEGPSAVSSEADVYKQGQKLMDAGITASRLQEIGKLQAADSVAYQLAGRVDENTGAYTLGKLFNEIDAEITEANKADIQYALQQKGMDAQNAKANAEVFSAVVAGAELTDFQRAVVERNDVLSKTVQEVIVNKNSTVNQRSQGYKELLMDLANQKVARTEQRLPGQENTTAHNNLPTPENSATESAYGASADGKTILNSTGETVSISEIASVKDGKMTLRLDNGSTVDAQDVSYASEGEALVYAAVADMDVNASAANVLVNAYHPGSGVSAEVYAHGIKEAYRYGQYNYPLQELARGPFSSMLTEHQRNTAYKLGKLFGGKQVAREQATVRKNRTTEKSSANGKVHFDGDRSSLTERQSESLSALETVADALGVQIHVFESSVDENGKRTGANGWYDPKNGSIHIDLYAGANGESTILFTAAHELTHFIKQWSPAKFKVLANFLMKEYGKKDVNVESLVQAQIAKAKGNGRTISYDTAYEEVIADSMETMLSDGKVMEKLAKLKQQDKSLWQKMKDFISDLSAKIRKVYEGMTPGSVEGRYVEEMKDAIEHLQKIFTEALVEASENYQSNLTAGDTTAVKYSDRDFRGQVDEVLAGTFDRTNAVYVGETPEILSKVGLNGNLPMLTTARHIRDAVKPKNTKRHHHGLTEGQIKSLPSKIADPVMVMDSRNAAGNSVVVVTDMLDTDNAPIIVSIQADGKGMYNNVEIDTNFITSYYGRDGFTKFVENNVKEDNFLYINRKKATALSTESNTQWFEQLKNYDFDTIIRRTRAKVKGNSAGDSVRYQDRSTESVSNRTLLANAFESVAQNDIERKRLTEYREKINKMEAEEQKLRGLNEQIKEMSFSTGKRDTAKIRELQLEAKKTANRIDIYDSQILRLEASAPLKAVLEREKKAAYKKAEQKGRDALEKYRQKALKKQQETVKRYQESRAKGIENRNKTAMRHKVQKVVNELNQFLLKGTKERHVPIGLQKAVAAALDAVNMDTVGAEERIAKLKADLLTAKTPEQIQEISRKIDRVQSMGDKMQGKLKALKEAYDSFISSDDPMVANAHDEVISAKLESIIESVGDTPLRDMSLNQLEDVYDMYQMVLTTIRNANKTFKAARNATVAELGGKVMNEVQQAGGKRQYSTKAMDAIRKFGWNNLKPVYAFEHIGSKTFSEIFSNVRAGEDIWAKDVTQARAFYLDKAKKYKFDSWKLDQWHEFTSTSGMDFSLNTEQIMSLYAYSKREQAADHLRRGGIVIDESTEVTMKTKLGLKVKFNPTEATAYNISDQTLQDIVSKLTPEQKAFVDEMQDYLSTVMGEKGNEVSLQLYGVKLFKEKNYFPLKSASQFMAKAKEQQQGEVKIKNAGFSKETVKKASNPIVLTPFMNVWAGHVNEMSMYHAFVLPMEDFYRVYNFKTPTSDLSATESVEMHIQNAYGKGATKYIDQLLKDLNGGARVDSTADVPNKLMGMFKKGAVFASASVVIQQPSAIARAAALVDLKYFIGTKVDSKRHKLLWEEVKQYAPVAAIKEMGYFDTNMGKSTEDFLLGKEYNTISDKAKALLADEGYRDEVLSKAPALADELTWCNIWEAVKRETKAKNPGMDVRSEMFLNKAGERFTEVIVKTQVYDSVLSRSANMRSKDTVMKMATAFMAEPTTAINMVADALLKAKRGDKKFCRKTIGSVVAAQILNSFLVSFVYAARDDDEDKSYWEKYLASLVSGTADGINPATYVPFVKDVMSIVQGYDVERSDMSVISDLWSAWEQLGSDNISPWRKVEGFVGSICQIFGLPVKNIMRDIRAVWQTFEALTNGEKTTARGIRFAIHEGLTGETVSDKQQLYESRMAGDTEHADRVEARYDDEKSANAAVKSAIRDSFMAGEIEMAEANKHLILYGGLDASDAHWTMDEWEYAKETGSTDGYGKYNNFYTAVESGQNLKAVIQEYIDNGVAATTLSGQLTQHYKDKYLEMETADRAGIKGYLLNAYELCGVDREKAMQKLNDWDFEATYGFEWSDRKQAYLEGKVSATDLKRLLVSKGGYTEVDAGYQIEAYEWSREGVENATTAAIRNYNEYCRNVGVPRDVYMKIRNFSNSTENDVDENGNKIAYSAMKKIMAQINALNITNVQKDAIARSMGWKESNIKKYKLW